MEESDFAAPVGSKRGAAQHAAVGGHTSPRSDLSRFRYKSHLATPSSDLAQMPPLLFLFAFQTRNALVPSSHYFMPRKAVQVTAPNRATQLLEPDLSLTKTDLCLLFLFHVSLLNTATDD